MRNGEIAKLKSLKYNMAFCLVLLLLSVFSVSDAWAEGQNNASEKTKSVSAPFSAQAATLSDEWTQCGTCEWRIENQVLTIRPLGNSSSGVLEDWGNTSPWRYSSHQIKKVKIIGSITPKTLGYTFEGCFNLKEIEGLSNLKATQVSMRNMFGNCSELDQIDFSEWHCSATDMSYMFYGCSSLRSLDFSTINSFSAINMTSMFEGCSSLEEIIWTQASDSSVTTMDKMFKNCSSLKHLIMPCSSSKLKWVNDIFSGCSTLESIDMSNWDSTSITNQKNMFLGCASLKEIKVGNRWLFDGSENLPAPSGISSLGEYTGLWVSADYPNLDAITSEELTNSKKSMPGTWVAQIKPSAIEISSIFVSVPNQTYSGSMLMPELSIKNGTTLLEKNVDYTVEFKNNVNVGNATATVNGIGKYTGTKTVTFLVQALDINSVSITVSDQVYSGKPLSPKPNVKNGNKTLIEGTDYTLEYRNTTSVGTGTVTIAGKGNYKGSKTVSFQIKNPTSNPPQSSVTSNSANKPSNATSTSSDRPFSNDATPISSSSVCIASLANRAPQTCSTVSGVWKKAGGKWWFLYHSGSKESQGKSSPANEWVKINNKFYHFDTKGYMHTGWQNLSNAWYYFGSDGAMKTGWRKSSGKWYFMQSDGTMKTGWLDNGGKRYYLNASGVMFTGWQKISGTWYYFNRSGAMAKGWQKVRGKWYFLDNSTGAMKTGWLDNSEKVYYLNGSGAMVVGWNKLSSKWYYFDKSGAMQKNKWISSKYWVGNDGAMATSSWVDSGKYYVNERGIWVKPNSPSGQNASFEKELAVDKLTSKTWITGEVIRPSEYILVFDSNGSYHLQYNWLKPPTRSHSRFGSWKYTGTKDKKYCFDLYTQAGKYDGFAKLSFSNSLAFCRNNGLGAITLKEYKG